MQKFDQEKPMAAEITARKSRDSKPIWFVRKGELEAAGLESATLSWAKANGFEGQTGRVLTVPSVNGEIAGALFGLGKDENRLAAGKLATALPEGAWHIAGAVNEPD